MLGIWGAGLVRWRGLEVAVRRGLEVAIERSLSSQRRAYAKPVVRVLGYGERLGERDLGWGVLVATFPFAGEYGLLGGHEMELDVCPCLGHIGSDLICGGRKSLIAVAVSWFSRPWRGSVNVKASPSFRDGLGS